MCVCVCVCVSVCVCVCVCVCVSTLYRVLNTLDRVAGAIIVMDEMPVVQVEENVVVEVVVRSQASL